MNWRSIKKLQQFCSGQRRHCALVSSCEKPLESARTQMSRQHRSSSCISPNGFAECSSGRYKHHAVLPFGNVQLQARRSNCTEGAITATHIGRTEDEMQAVSVEIEIHENLPPIARAWNANCSEASEQNSKDVPLAKNTLAGVGMRRIGPRVPMVAVEAGAFRMSVDVNRCR